MKNVETETFLEDMAFLQSAYAFGKRGLESNLHKIQVNNLEAKSDRFLNTSVYLKDVIHCAEFMLKAEKKTVDLYRNFNKLNG